MIIFVSDNFLFYFIFTSDNFRILAPIYFIEIDHFIFLYLTSSSKSVISIVAKMILKKTLGTLI